MNRYSVIRARADDTSPVHDGILAIPKGFPIILDLLLGEVCESLTLFLLKTRIKRDYPQGYTEAVMSEAQDLRDFFEFCDHFNISWQDVNEHDK